MSLVGADASFKRPLLSVNVSVRLSVCASATLMLNISVIKRFSGSCPIGTYGKVPTERWLMTSSMMSRDYDVTLVTYRDVTLWHLWRHNVQSRRIRKQWPGSITGIRVMDPLTQNIVLKISSFGNFNDVRHPLLCSL